MARRPTQRPGQATLDLSLDRDAEKEPFIESEANRVVLDRLREWSSWPSLWLAVVGPERSGLTTLARQFAKKSGFTFVSGQSLNSDDRDRLDGLARTGAAIDDADCVSDGYGLMALLNRCDEYGRPAVLFSHTLPSQISLDPADLRSRLRAISVVEIEPPDDRLMSKLLMRSLKERFVFLPDKVEELLLSRLPRSYAVIEDYVERLVVAMSRDGRGLSVALAKEVLAQGPSSRDLFTDLDDD